RFSRDWSSDVCSSDLSNQRIGWRETGAAENRARPCGGLLHAFQRLLGALDDRGSRFLGREQAIGILFEHAFKGGADGGVFEIGQIGRAACRERVEVAG